MLTQDIARHQPDVILVDQVLQGFDWLAWANLYPALAAQLKPYRRDRKIGGILILWPVQAHWPVLGGQGRSHPVPAFAVPANERINPRGC
jgi:hypothetical protein